MTPALVLVACADHPDKHTLASLHQVPADTSEVKVEDGLDKAMQSYRRFLDETPDGAMTPEAMRRLADLKLEKEYGILGDGKIVEVAAPQAAGAAALAAPLPTAKIDAQAAGKKRRAAIQPAAVTESERALEQRAMAQQPGVPEESTAALDVPEGVGGVENPGPLEAIRLYDALLEKYPHYANRDQVLYQKARAYDELGRTAEAMKVMEQLIAANPGSRYVDEVQFRRAEHFFAHKKFRDAETAYAAIVTIGPASEYYELALYKLGWSLYKQDFYEEALHQYFALLDYKVSRGYDFDAKHEPAEERRVEDTFQVTSLSLSNLGGPEVIGEYFATNGHRAYEDRVYRHFGEFYLKKLRYQDAAKVYGAFVELYPFHAVAPHFSMRAIEIYELGGFPKLVLDSKKTFASHYGLQGEYWRHFDVGEVARSARLPQGEPEGSREPLSRPVSGQGTAEGEARQLRRGLPLVSRVPRPRSMPIRRRRRSTISSPTS